MTFNIFHDTQSPPEQRNIPAWDGRKDLVVGTIRAAGPDVLGLQEAYPWQAEFLTAELPQYAAFGRGLDASGLGWTASILYRTERFAAADSGHFWFSDTPDSAGTAWSIMSLPRIVTWLRLTERATARSFYVYNTHLSSGADGGRAAREVSVRLLADRIHGRRHPDDHVFLIGDFNALASAFPVAYLTGDSAASPMRFIDTWGELHPLDGSGTQCRNDPAGNRDDSRTGVRIDYIFVTNPGPSAQPPRIAASGLATWGPSCASDHRALTSTVTVYPD
jgi:endonuclease/exonuclease/phosphatase family metal-dependent hydrolase